MDMMRGIVVIKGHPKSTEILGTGFFLSGGLILTCAHVIDPYYRPGGAIYFQAEEGRTEIQRAQVVFYSSEEKYDLAVLKPEGEPGGDPLPLVSSRNSKGRDFTIYGYPRLGELRGFNGRGKVLGWTNDVRGFKTLQLDCRQVTQGFSGAPVWDEAEGAVIGMLQKGIKDPETGRPSFALPMEVAQEAFPKLPVGEPRSQSLEQAPSFLEEFKGFVVFLQNLWAVLAGISVLFPLSNLLTQIIPLAQWPEGGLAYLSPQVVTAISTLACLFVIFWIFGQRPQFEDRRKNLLTRKQAGLYFVYGLAALIVYLAVHYAVVNNFYYEVLGWGSGDLRRAPGDLVLLLAYGTFFVLVTRAFMLLGMIEYFGRKAPAAG